MKYLNIFALGLLLLAGCAKDLGYQQALQGSWQGVQWTVENKPDGRDAAGVKFTFTDNNYKAVLGAREEAGSFRVDGDKLYTHAEGQQEIMVKIIKLTADSLAFDMNRGGISEKLLLKKE
ncbi:MAG: lipocalin family protein [Saprospiraceae bacterium]|nr:lipocalin family protein [Saprospiraceae bacterium]MCF8248829.1 lipocalin family protein [Saprospiraceae bacterium]MCF8279880.1 lipocalin family protein [Bacteroidales bacterium]MCF8310114.1 lipocalin family protein [Saprospiraceae bacterium]MCF8439014.1 lipocalin family protein [Saprospiraceae bacterium]